MEVKPVDIICPHCGFIDTYFNPSKFPICECCDYEDPIVMSQEEYSKFIKELKAKDPSATTYEAHCEALREKYVYPSEHFSKKAYNDMLKYAEEKKKRIQEEYDRNFNAPRCPKCGCAEFQMVPRKWSLFTGFATNKVDRVCVRCKTKF